MGEASYRTLADEIARDIAEGRLQPGARLPPHRDYAYERGIAVSTAGRVYRELVRRGLIVGEVGRGSFVRAAPPSGISTAFETAAPVNLESSVPLLPEQAELLAPVMASLVRLDVLASAQEQVRPTASVSARETIAAFLAREGWAPVAEDILVAASARRALAAALGALAGAGDKVAVEAVTYPHVKGLAARLGFVLVPVAVDQHGLRPDALEKVHREAPGIRTLYVQPAMQNPLSLTMPLSRRRALAETLERLEITAVEDAVYSFLAPEAPPLAALAPRHVIHVDSLSKRVAPGFSLGMAVVPPGLRPVMGAALHNGAWTPGGLALEVALRVMRSGLAADMAARKAADARARQALAVERLDGLVWHSDPRSYYGWLELPPPWRAETFVAAMARRGVAVASAMAFAVGSGHAPNAVRVALARPPLAVLEEALETLRAVALGGPDEYVLD